MCLFIYLLASKSLDDFFSSRPPAKRVSGARHSSRVRKLSKRTTDPDNTEAGDTLEDATSSRKRRAGDAASLTRRVSREVIQLDSDDDTASDDGNKSGLTDVDANSNEDMNACTQLILIYVMQFDKYYTPRPPSLPETTTSVVGKLSVVL